MKYSDFLRDSKFLGGGDGSSFENAIIIKVDKTMNGVSIEYDYVSKLYGTKNVDWKLKLQGLAHKGDKRYDVLAVVLKNGEKKSIYFDITQFFGK